MNRQTLIYRKAQFDKVIREQDKSEDYMPSIKIVSGNGNGATNFMQISLEELGAIRLALSK